MYQELSESQQQLITEIEESMAFHKCHLNVTFLPGKTISDIRIVLPIDRSAWEYVLFGMALAYDMSYEIGEFNPGNGVDILMLEISRA